MFRKCKVRFRKKRLVEIVVAIKPRSLLDESDNEVHYKRAVKTLLDEEPDADINEPKHAR